MRPRFVALIVILIVVFACLAFLKAGLNPVAIVTGVLAQWTATMSGQKPLSSMGALAVLGFGLILGFKHATEADHVIAVSNIVSEHRKISKVAMVGGLWGAGHTATLLLVGLFVLLLRVTIPERIANYLEFCVALMIIGLSGTALARALRGRHDVHIHRHAHDGSEHTHLHFHDKETEHNEAAHRVHSLRQIGPKPFLVGAMHGLAGSAALTLLVLSQVSSVVLGLAYLAIFGIGSIFGMMAVSVIIGLPFAFSAQRLAGATLKLQAVTGLIGLLFGGWYAFHVGSAML